MHFTALIRLIYWTVQQLNRPHATFKNDRLIDSSQWAVSLISLYILRLTINLFEIQPEADIYAFPLLRAMTVVIYLSSWYP